MLSPKIIKIIENHFEFSVWENSPNKLFKSVFINREITSEYRYQKAPSTPVTPLLKGKRVNATAVPPSPAFTVWHFVTKCAAVKFAKRWMSKKLFESRDASYVGSALCPECSGKDWQVLLATPTGKRPRRSPKDQVEWLHLRPCLVPSWYGASRTIWDLLLVMRHLDSSYSCCHRNPLQKKSGQENEWQKMTIRGSIHDNAQLKSSSTFKPASTFRFHGNKSHLSVSKCLQ